MTTNLTLDQLGDDRVGYRYTAMADEIQAQIEAGEWRPGTPLPAERRLAEIFVVSLGTARRATELLRQRGIAYTLRSKGTFIESAGNLRKIGIAVPPPRPATPGNDDNHA